MDEWQPAELGRQGKLSESNAKPCLSELES